MNDAKVIRVDHIAAAVRDLEKTLGVFEQIFGVSDLHRFENDRDGFRGVAFRLGSGSRFELITPTRPDSFLSRFLSERGEGFHHVTLEVTDLDGLIGKLEGLGFKVLRGRATDTYREAFIHPVGFFGMLIQLTERMRAGKPAGEADGP